MHAVNAQMFQAIQSYNWCFEHKYWVNRIFYHQQKIRTNISYTSMKWIEYSITFHTSLLKHSVYIDLKIHSEHKYEVNQEFHHWMKSSCSNIEHMHSTSTDSNIHYVNKQPQTLWTC